MNRLESQLDSGNQSELDTSSALFGDTWARSPQAAPERPLPPQEQDEIPQPTPQQIQAMHAQAAVGRLDNDTARGSAARSVITNGIGGLTDFRNEMNTQLERANSDYRARVVRADGPNGVINLYVILQNQRNNENLADMARDLIENGANSRYRNRAIHLELSPERRPDI